MKVIFLIMTRNEEKGIAKVIREIKKTRPAFEIYVMDKSEDRTAEIARKCGAKVFLQKSKGKGNGLREVLPHLPGDAMVVITDGDDTYSLSGVSQMLKIMDKNTMVMGSRFMGKLAGMPRFNRFGNRLQSLLLSVLFLRWLTDINTGLRIFPANSLKNIRTNSPGFELEAEWTCKAIKHGMKVKEVPVDYRERAGVTNLHPVKDGFRIFKRIVQERLGL